MKKAVGIFLLLLIATCAEAGYPPTTGWVGIWGNLMRLSGKRISQANYSALRVTVSRPALCSFALKMYVLIATQIFYSTRLRMVRLSPIVC
jgi:hypothetical protein